MRPPLITVKNETETVVLLKRAGVIEQVTDEEAKNSALPEAIQEAIARELLPQHRIKVPKSLLHPHAIIARKIAEEARQQESYKKWRGYRHEPPDSTERRRRRIVSGFLRAAEGRGFKMEKHWDRQSDFVWIV